MNNEEALTAFDEFLQIDSQCRLLMGTFSPPRTAAMVRELAAATAPVPLEEVTDKEIRIFLRDRKVPSVAVRSLPLSEAHARARMEKAKAELRYAEYQAAMLCFRHFRSSVLKPRRKQVQS